MRLLGTIPGPIIGGKLIDLTCIAWQESCGERGNCRLYDRDLMSKTFLGVYLVYKETVQIIRFKICLPRKLPLFLLFRTVKRLLAYYVG